MTELAVPSGDIQKQNDPKIKPDARLLKIRLTKEIEILCTPMRGYAECFESLRAQCKNAVMPLDMWSIISPRRCARYASPFMCWGKNRTETLPVISWQAHLVVVTTEKSVGMTLVGCHIVDVYSW